MRNEDHKSQQKTQQQTAAQRELARAGVLGVGQVRGRRMQQVIRPAEPPPHTMNVVQEGRNEPIIPRTVGPAGAFVEQNNPPKDLTMIPGVDEKRAGAIAQASGSQVHGAGEEGTENLPQNQPQNNPGEIQEKPKQTPVLPGQPGPEQIGRTGTNEQSGTIPGEPTQVDRRDREPKNP